jgi:hypothetical protein
MDRFASLARGCEFRDHDGFPVLIDIASELNAFTGVSCESCKALVFDVIDFVTAGEYEFASALDTSECAFGILAISPIPEWLLPHILSLI